MQLPATLTIQHAAAAHVQLQSAIAQAPGASAFVVDAAALQDFDTSALAVLLEGCRAAQARGLGFAIERPPAKLGQLAALYGVGDLLGLKAA